MSKLLCAMICVAAVASAPLHAQQPEPTQPNYPVLTLVFAAGAVGGFVVYANTPTCTAMQRATLDAPPSSGSAAASAPTTPQTNCDTQQALKTGALVVGIGCTIGFVWSLLHANRMMRERSGALITTSPHAAPVFQPPDFSYDAARHDLRVLLVHTTF